MYISLTNSPAPADDKNRVTLPGKRTPRGIRTASSTVITLGIVSMLTDISSESVSAILPLYITGFLGLSTIAFGVLDGLYQGTSAVVRIAGGYASDRLDQPKWVAFVGYSLAAIARVGLLFWTGFAALSAVITADRIGKGIRTAPRDALITATSDPARLAAAFGVHRMLDNIGAAIGPFLAFVILLVVPDGFHVVFVASLAFATIGVAILGFVVPNVRSRRRARDEARVRMPWRTIADAVATVLCLVFLGGFYAATDGVLSALTSQLTPAESRATAIASAQTVVAVARFVSAAGFGILWFALGRDLAMLVVAIVLAVALPLVAVLLHPLLRRTAAADSEAAAG